jgi:hypothetical protein
VLWKHIGLQLQMGPGLVNPDASKNQISLGFITIVYSHTRLHSYCDNVPRFIIRFGPNFISCASYCDVKYAGLDALLAL